MLIYYFAYLQISIFLIIIVKNILNQMNIVQSKINIYQKLKTIY